MARGAVLRSPARQTMRPMKKSLFCLAALFLASLASAQEISLRHSLQGEPRVALATLAERFNALQKGKARIALEDLASVSDRRQLPVLALLDTNDTRQFFDTLPRFKPLYQATPESGVSLGSPRFYPLVADAASNARGRLEALPLGLSLPALFWNKVQFRHAGLDPDKAPATWHDVQDIAGALFDDGSPCPLTSARFSWVHLENVAAQHREPLVSRPGAVVLNNLIGVKHLALLSSWSKSSYFRYYGPGREADAHFLSGECAMMTGEASFLAEARHAGLDVGVGLLPYYDDVYAANRANVLPDGQSLWLLAGKRKEEYRVALRFIAFLLRPENQRAWVQATAFLPMTRDALAALRASDAPAALLLAAEARLNAPVAVARPRGLEVLQPLNDALSEEMPFVWRNEKPAKQALDNAMERANAGLSARNPRPTGRSGRL